MNATANVFWEVKMQTTIFCWASRFYVCARLCQRFFRLFLAFCWWNTERTSGWDSDAKTRAKERDKKFFVSLEFQANFQIRTRKSMFIVLKNVKNSLFSFVCRRTQMLTLKTISFFLFLVFDISQQQKKRKKYIKQYKVFCNKNFPISRSFFFSLAGVQKKRRRKKIRHVLCSLANNCLLFDCNGKWKKKHRTQKKQVVEKHEKFFGWYRNYHIILGFFFSFRYISFSINKFWPNGCRLCLFLLIQPKWWMCN